MDPLGNDGADGLSTATAWASLTRCSGAALSPGDSVLFKRGGSWRGQLIPVSGGVDSPIRYGAYGSGMLPRITGATDASPASFWVFQGSGIWSSTAPVPYDVGNLYFNSAYSPIIGVKKWTEGALSAQGDFYYDRVTGYLKVSAGSNPGLAFSSIDLALRFDIASISSRSWVIFEDLHFTFGGANGINGSSSSHITVRRCDFSYLGGSDMNLDGSNIRYGNGVQFWQGASDNLVERCRFWEIYDTAVTNQGHSAVADQRNIIYRNNIIGQVGFAALEIWNYGGGSSRIENVQFLHNKSLYPGSGWGGVQRPDTKGMHVYLDAVSNSPIGVKILGNQFQGGNLGLWVKETSSQKWNRNTVELDYNAYGLYPPGQLAILNDIPLTFGISQFADYQALTQEDPHSLPEEIPGFFFEHPQFKIVPPLQEVRDDFSGAPRPAYLPSYIGAFQGPFRDLDPAPKAEAKLPVVAKSLLEQGEWACIYYDAQVSEGGCRIHTLAGELVRQLAVQDIEKICWPVKGMAKGIYLLHCDFKYTDGAKRRHRQKFVLR